MPRHSDAHVPGALYHVTLRGAYLTELYFSSHDRGLLITILSEVVERFAGKVHCYSNAQDRLQLLIQVGEEPLGRMLLRVARRYAHAVQTRLLSSMPDLPEVSDAVNRLFDIRVRTAAPLRSASSSLRSHSSLLPSGTSPSGTHNATSPRSL